MNSYEQMREIALSLLWPLAIISSGFIVRVVRFGVSSWKQLVASGTVSVFTGMIVYMALESVLSIKIALAISMLCSYVGGILLDALQAGALKAVDKAVDKAIDKIDGGN